MEKNYFAMMDKVLEILEREEAQDYEDLVGLLAGTMTGFEVTFVLGMALGQGLIKISQTGEGEVYELVGSEFISLDIGHEIEIEPGFGKPRSQKTRTDIIFLKDGDSLITLAGIRLCGLDAGGVRKKKRGFSDFGPDKELFQRLRDAVSQRFPKEEEISSSKAPRD